MPRLPDSLERYFAAQNAHDIDALVDCFSPDARVRDEGQDIVGQAAVRAWKESTSARYKVAVEPLGLARREGRHIVEARVSGNFNGSPAVLRYDFGLDEQGRIASLAVS